HHLARLVGLPVGPGHGVGVGQVGGHHVEALRLRAGRAAGDVEDLEQTHAVLLNQAWFGAFIASSSVRACALMKRSVASYFTVLSAKAARSRSMSTLL